MKAAIPLINEKEWEHYITLPTQQPPPVKKAGDVHFHFFIFYFIILKASLPSSTTDGRVRWWKSRLADFPSLAPVAIAYLLTPRSAAQAERTFSRLGHNVDRPFLFFFSNTKFCPFLIQTSDRLNMVDPTLQGLAFMYLNKGLFQINP